MAVGARFSGVTVSVKLSDVVWPDVSVAETVTTYWVSVVNTGVVSEAADNVVSSWVMVKLGVVLQE